MTNAIVGDKGHGSNMCELCNLAAYNLGQSSMGGSAFLASAAASSSTITAKWGGATAGTTSGAVTWSFATQNYASQSFQFDAAITAQAYQTDVRAAFKRWEQVANLHFVEQTDSASTDIRLGWDAIDGPFNTIGETFWWQTSGQFNWALIRFDTAETYSTGGGAPGTNKIDFYTLALHEIGHAIGLNHDDTQPSIMNSRQNSSVLDLTAGDIAKVQAIYGTGELIISGGIGDDILVGTTSNETFNGGAGRDTVVLSGLHTSYSVTKTTDGWTTVGPSGTDHLVSIERIRFDDGTQVLDSSDPAYSVYRLYVASLGRLPDAAGLTAWTYALSTGMSTNEMARQFTTAPEFIAKYTALNNASFVQALYGNILGRSGDSGGLSGWTHALDAGTLSRADVILGFADSAENVTLVANTTPTGLWMA